MKPRQFDTRKAYSVIECPPPICEEVSITITPKRVAVQDRFGLSYYEPDKFWLRYKDTPVDAWLLFLNEERLARNGLEEQLAFVQSQIMAGEAYFDSISPFKNFESSASPDDYQS
jgi:hypothetical protein